MESLIRPVQAILVDMDGTLLDSEALYKSLWQSTAREFGIDLNDLAYQRFIGARFDQCKDFIAELGGKGFSLPAFLKRLDEQESGTAAIPLKTGALELLTWLGEQSEKQPLACALVTSAGRDKIEQNFSRADLQTLGGLELFDTIVCGDDVQHPKPHPQPYSQACQQLGLSPGQTLAIEDSNSGARSALAAGCQTVFIPDVLPADTDILEQALMLDDLPALLLLLKKA